MNFSMMRTVTRSGLIAFLFGAVLVGAPVLAQETPPAAPETPETPNYCVYRCSASEPSTTDSAEYARWKSFAMPIAECRTGDTCAQQCEIDCASRSGGTTGGGTTGRRHAQRGAAPTAPAAEVGSACDRENVQSVPIAPQCSEGLASPRPNGATAGVCLFKCPGTANWNSGFFPQACTAQGCSFLCNTTCGTTCGESSSSCQPIPGQGNTNFQASTQGAAATSTGRTGAVGPYGLRDPLGGATPQRLIAGFIRYILGFVGALFFGMFVWSGILWMTAGGDVEKVKTAKSTIVNAAIGMFIVAASYTIVSLIISLPALLGA